MTRVLRVVSVTPQHPSRQEGGWETRRSTVHLFIDLGLKTQLAGDVELTVAQANELIEKLVIATGQARRANEERA